MEKKEYTVQDFNEVLENIRKVRKLKEEHKEVLSKIEAKKKELEFDLIRMLKESSLRKWEMESEDGTRVLFSIAETFSVKTPKTIEEKAALWDYLENKYGADAAMAKFSVNANTLNSLWREEYDSLPDAEKALWELPGVGTPTMYEEPRLKES